MWWFKILFLCSTLEFAFGANILGIFPHPGKSHFVMFERLMIALAEKGHQVDVVTHFFTKSKIPGYNEISLEGSMPIFVNNFTASFFEDLSYGTNIISQLKICGVMVCEKTLQSPAMKELKNSKKQYDLVITEVFAMDCMLGFGHHFRAPIISVTSSVNMPWASDRIGNPDSPSYIPMYFLHATGKMSLYERLVNTVVLLQAKYIYSGFMKEYTRITKEFFGPNLPDLEKLASNTSLILVNSHFSMNQARPAVPSFIEVGGLHIKEPGTLPKAFEKLIMSGQKGTIFFSMGSLMRVETFPFEKLQGIFDAFSELSAYTVIWKGDRETFSNDLKIPSNVHFEKWVPQMELLCHPNVKLFVTHGGQMGSQEATYCGVPRLGIPLFSDQESNVRQSENMEAAVRVGYEDISKKAILEASLKLLNDPKYKQNAAKISKLFKDRPMQPLETAIYWVEYVIRHKGAPHLRTIGADLPWYQYHLVDVGLILLSVLLLTMYAGVLVTRFGLKLLFGLCMLKPKSD